MKTFLLFALLAFSVLAVQAQPRIINNTPCPMRIVPGCYDPNTCTGTGQCAPFVIAPPFSNTTLLPLCTCPSPTLNGYAVCYGPATGCGTICTAVGNFAGPCPGWPIPATLPPCPGCGNVPRTITYNSAGDMIIQ